MTFQTSNQVRQQVESVLRETNYELPENFRESPRSTACLVDGALLERYSKIRDDYLKKSIEVTVAEKVPTFDGQGFPYPEPPPLTEQELHDKRQEATSKLHQTHRNALNSLDQLQADFARLQERKEDLRRMLEEFEGDADSLDLGEDQDENVVDDEDLEAQQERLLALQQRKKELMAKLHRLQEEHRNVELENTETEANLSILSCDDEAIVEIEKANNTLREKIEENEEMAGYFETMRLVTEELSGIRLVSVDEGNTDVDVVLRIEVLHAHQVEIGLQADERKKEGLRVASAKLLTPPRVTVEAADDQARTIELPIPVLDDLVSLAQPQPRSKALVFVVQETVSRIEMIHERAEELCRLVGNKSFLMERSISATNNFGRCDHEVVFMIPEHDVKVLVRMTPDCPRIPGSVYLHGVLGPKVDENLMNDILQESHKTKYKRPQDLLNDVKQHLDSCNY